MQKNDIDIYTKNLTPNWVTIQEAVGIANKLTNRQITDSDIYRHALYGKIRLSIYFQSPPILRKIKSSENKIKLRPTKKSLRYQLCMPDMNDFINGHNLILSTEGKYIVPEQLVINTELRGYELVLIQRLLANSLNMPQPITGANDTNYGITVTLSNQMFQVFEKMTWQQRIKQQIMRLPEHIIPDIYAEDLVRILMNHSEKGYFPIYNLPKDACFVIRQEDLDKFLGMATEKFTHSSSSRISTPLSRLFWLACKHNDSISSLLRHPYKLLPIFEQWASVEGFTDQLSSETLKRALERGSPTSVSK
ncbi:hypothetical protein VC191_09410 [Citrobacter koseri]|uniref:hypothetical protein n=1 Tax=Citrobacter koseri TaxID=545 RepID=UPI002B38C9F4|nr:hypothetical protein [Citrobacter koseri]MEB2704011.1 hypothetical protein [Citrobacter koseri]MEB2709608.1 hypothetical protein [Citrobacter koseri]